MFTDHQIRLAQRAHARAALLAALCSASFARGADLHVPADFATVQEAVDAAAAGDTIHIAAGTYEEQLVIFGKHLMLADANEYLKMLALSRLYLDNIPNIRSSWVTQGPKIGQLALFFGANDMGSVMMEENVVSAAGATYRLDEAEIRRLISDAGWQPRKRNCYYELIEPNAARTEC